MTIQRILQLLNGKLHTPDIDLSTEICSACGSDLMSDVLAFAKCSAVLLTGLINPQVVRTAEMMDMRCIVFVRGKTPTEEMIALAKEHDIAMISANLRLYPACGILYANGLTETE